MVSTKRFLSEVEERASAPKNHGDCPLCGHPITNETESGENPQFVKIEGKDVRAHADCYWDALGDAIEKHPVAKPGGR